MEGRLRSFFGALEGKNNVPGYESDPSRREGDIRHKMFQMVYGREPSPSEMHKLPFHVPAKQTSQALRSMIAAFDRQTHPTPVAIRFERDELVCLDYQGIKLWLDRCDIAVSGTVIGGSVYEPHVTAFIKERIKPGMAMVDIGANVGIFTMLSASLGAKVYAFEPNTENCRLILLSRGENGFDEEVTLFPIALCDHSGVLYYTPNIGSNGGLMPNRTETLMDVNCVVVPAMRLDDLVDGPIHFIKADVEGAEYLALKGGERLIREYKPIITIELSMEMSKRVSGIDGGDLIRWLKSLGYRAFILEANGERTEITDVSALCQHWGSLARIEDMAFIPSSAVS